MSKIDYQVPPPCSKRCEIWETRVMRKEGLCSPSLPPKQNLLTRRISFKRIFIRCACNEGCLHDYISALAWNTELTSYVFPPSPQNQKNITASSNININYHCSKYYNISSILLSDDREIFLLLLETLKKFTFRFVVKDKALEKANYWDTIKIDQYVSTLRLPPPPNFFKKTNNPPPLFFKVQGHLLKNLMPEEPGLLH